MSFLQNNRNENKFFDNTDYPAGKGLNLSNANINMDQSDNNILFSQVSDINANPPTCFENKNWLNEFELPDGANNYTKGHIDENGGAPGAENGTGGNGSLSSLSPTTHKSLSTPNSNSSMFSNDKMPVVEENADKKKAQNRAAQRAFRERKEAKLNTLEHQLKESEANKEALQKEVDSLRKLNQEIHAENRTLLRRQDDDSVSNLMNYNPINSIRQYSDDQMAKENVVHRRRDDFYKDLMNQVNSVNEIHGQKVQNKTYQDNSGNFIMTIPATWEYLQKNYGEDIDIIQVIEALKGKEVCHGAGGAYPKVLVDEAIQQLMDAQ